MESKPKKKVQTNPELLTISRIMRTLDALEPAARERIMKYLSDHYRMQTVSNCGVPCS